MSYELAWRYVRVQDRASARPAAAYRGLVPDLRVAVGAEVGALRAGCVCETPVEEGIVYELEK